MRILLFGAGATGRIALHFLGYDRVKCFVDNNRFGEEEQGKNIINFSEMLNILQKDDIIAVTSEKYHEELEDQIKAHGINKYFIFRESDLYKITEVLPQFLLYGKMETISYTRCLSDYHICRYKKIAIIGTNLFLQYLLMEIAFQNGWSSIAGLIDDTAEKEIMFGIPVVRLDEIWDSIDCLIINVRRTESDIHNLLESRKHTFTVVDIYKIDQFNCSFYHPELQKYKDIHKGKRAFVVGNGPSLRIEDLDILHKHKEICFGFNRIYRVYNRTQWRADYVGITDIDMIHDCYNDLDTIEGEVFLGDCYPEDLTCVTSSHVNVVHLEHHEYYPNYPDFSADITKGICWGYTTAYDIGLQIAVYMGFEQIYLIGLDNSIVGNVADERNHFIPDYYTEDEKNKYNKRISEQHKITRAYEKAEAYSRQHGFRIYNATRGGALEVFERVDFDSLF